MSRTTNKPDKRTAILEAALDLISENGFHGAPTSKIAARAGAGIGSIYRYFKDKDELIHAVFLECERDMKPAILNGHNPSAPMREQYIGLCTRACRYLVDHRRVFFFMEQYFNSPYGMSTKREKLLSIDDENQEADKHPVVKLLNDAKVQQVAKDLPIPVLQALTFGPMLFLLRDIHGGLVEYDEAMLEQMVEACWDAVKR